MKVQNRYKPLLFVGIGILVLAIFFWLVARPSSVDSTIKELSAIKDYDKVKILWGNHKTEFSGKSKWMSAVQSHLSNMPLTHEQQTDLATWFPVRTYLNAVVLPDLSGRLVSEPYPTENDKEVIGYIWQAFRESTRKSYLLYGENSQNVLRVDMTRERELQLKELAKKLIIDCSKTKQPSIPYLGGVQNDFHQAVSEVYEIGTKQTQGADYFKYINENLNDRRVDSSPFIKFRNLVIILTDGYLETTKGQTAYYTGSPSQLSDLTKGRRAGKTWDQLFTGQRLLIQKRGASTPNLDGWEVLILQVRDRKDGDSDVLEKLWGDWFTGLGAKWTPKLSFQKYQIAPVNNKNVIARFFSVEPSTLRNLAIAQPPATPGETTANNTDTDKYKMYDKLVAEAEKSVQSNDFKQGKILFTKASQLRQTANMPISPKAEVVYQKYVHFADDAHQTFIETGTEGLDDIPARYYELAMLIKPSADVRRKLAASTNP